jgi:hypothetical protein
MQARSPTDIQHDEHPFEGVLSPSGLNIEVRSSTVLLSQVELCFNCPNFVKSRGAHPCFCVVCWLTGAHPPAGTQLVCLLLFFFFANFLFCSPITVLYLPSCRRTRPFLSRAHHDPLDGSLVVCVAGHVKYISADEHSHISLRPSFVIARSLVRKNPSTAIL